MNILRLTLALVLIWGSAQAQDTTRTITVTGHGSAASAPDMATISLGVETDARRADEALSANSALMSDVFETLTQDGIDPSDIQTSNLSLFPQYDNRSSGQGVGIARYVARNMLTIRVRELDSLGGILDRLNEAGANRINAITFGFADPDPLTEIARKKAVADGIARAQLYAEAANVALGPLLTLSDSTSGAMPRPMARAEAMAMDVPIAGGELSLTATVHMVFTID